MEGGKIRVKPLGRGPTRQINPSCSLGGEHSDRMSSAAPGFLVNYSSFSCRASCPPLYSLQLLVLCSVGHVVVLMASYLSPSPFSLPPTQPTHLCPFPRCQTQCTSTPQSFPKRGRRRPSLSLCYTDMCLWCR